MFYMEREEKSSPDNVILYYRLTPSSSITADDSTHEKSDYSNQSLSQEETRQH